MDSNNFIEKKQSIQTKDIGIQVNMDEHELLQRGTRIKLQNVKKLILSGGFLKGYSFVGCIKYLIENNIHHQINTIIGSSVGSLMSLLLVLDYKLDEFDNLVNVFNFNKYINITTENIINFTENFGLDDGEKFTQAIKNFIYKKTNNYYITFKQLYDINKKTFVVSGTNLLKRKTEFFSHLTTPDMPVWIAIRISTSFPIFYNLVEYDGNKYFDGAASSHCSIEFIEDFMKDTIDDTLCISISKLKNYENSKDDKDNIIIKHKDIKNKEYTLYNYIMDISGSLRYRDIIRLNKYSYNLLEVDCVIDSFTENLNKETIIEIINTGYLQINTFFN